VASDQAGMNAGGHGRTILVIDDDPHIQFVLQVMLEDANLRVLPAFTAEAGLLIAAERQVDLALVDLRLPGLSGLDVLPSLRATSPMPILVITAHGEGTDVITGLDRGADDYLTKPFSRWDLITRVTSQLAGYHDGPATTVGRLQLLPEKSQVLLDGQPIALSRTEASALARLMAADGGVVSSAELLRSPWGYRRTGDNRVVASMITRLRAKLGDNPTDPQILLDEPGRGYRISTRITAPPTTEPPEVPGPAEPSELTWLTGQAPAGLRRSG
jgi:DNA-binding response OmpR family regulator